MLSGNDSNAMWSYLLKCQKRNIFCSVPDFAPSTGKCSNKCANSKIDCIRLSKIVIWYLFFSKSNVNCSRFLRTELWKTGTSLFHETSTSYCNLDLSFCLSICLFTIYSVSSGPRVTKQRSGVGQLRNRVS